ncbi:MAG: LacI family DNA-binding transcriptional regulator [Anaerolineae bacterium]|nr:LacI family DNA-binding transcriptional regulator [Anaerolineae bacterium]
MVNRPKLQDVADLAGVSIGTASRVFNCKPNVLPETRQRVLAAAEQLSYRPAEPVSTKETLTIGVLATLTPDENAASNPFYGAVLAGIDHECHKQRIRLMYATVRRAAHAVPAEWPLLLRDPQVDGLILMGQFDQETIERVHHQSGKVMVLVNTHAQPAAYGMVMFDNYLGGYKATRYLIEQGHRHIGIVGSHPTTTISGLFQRREGYVQALRDYNIPDTYFSDSSHELEDVFEATITFVQQHPQVTAIFVCFDLAAHSVFRAAQVLNCGIPEDLSVIGFDDIPLASQMTPTLTTMRVDVPLMGAMGVRQLVDRLENPTRVPLRILLRPQLVLRDSVRPLAVP